MRVGEIEEQLSASDNIAEKRNLVRRLRRMYSRKASDLLIKLALQPPFRLVLAALIVMRFHPARLQERYRETYIQVLATSDYGTARSLSCDALGSLADPELLSVFVTAAGDPDGFVRVSVCWALANLGQIALARSFAYKDSSDHVKFEVIRDFARREIVNADDIVVLRALECSEYVKDHDGRVRIWREMELADDSLTLREIVSQAETLLGTLIPRADS